MQRAIGWVALAVCTGGCLVGNPDFGGAVTASAGDGAGASSGAETGSSGVVPTTGAASEGGSEGSSGADATTAAASTGETEGPGSTGSTSAAAPVCIAKETLPIVAEAWDTGVVPATMGSPCPWGDSGPCEDLNFGLTQFYRTVNDPVAGRNAALVAFPRQAIIEQVIAAGHDPAQIVAFYLSLVVWEPKAQPDADVVYRVELLGVDDSGWYEGYQASAVGGVNDSSFKCKRIDADGCKPWLDPGGAQANVTPVGALVVTAAAAAATDEDQEPAQYHSRITSDPLLAAPILEHLQVADATLVVSLESPRALAEGTIGIKLKESPWSNPGLAVDVCTQWFYP